MKEQQKCKNCDQVSKKLKVAKSDYEFQIKKLTEDLSTEKALFELTMNKQLKKANERYEKEKQLHEEENKKWMQKYDYTVNQTNLKIMKIQSQTAKRIAAIQESSALQMRNFRKNRENECKRTIQQKQKACRALIESEKTKMTDELIKQKQKSQKNKMDSEILHKIQIEKTIKSYEGIIMGLRCENKTQQSLHISTKRQHQEKLAKLYDEIYGKKRQIYGLEGEISDLKKDIVNLNQQVRQLNQQIEKIKQENQKDIEELKQAYSTDLSNIRTQYRKNLQKLYHECKLQNQRYSSSLKNIEEKVEQERKIYQQNIEEIKNSIDQRPSKYEDIQEIIQLKEILYQKTKQISMINQEVKWYRLELQNKEQTYNKIFVSSNNQNLIAKKKQFKLRRAGKSVVTVKEILNSNNSADIQNKMKIQPKIL